MKPVWSSSLLLLLLVSGSACWAQLDREDFPGTWRSLYKTCETKPDINIDFENVTTWKVGAHTISVSGPDTTNDCDYTIKGLSITISCEGNQAKTISLLVSPDEMEIEYPVAGCPAHQGRLVFGRK